MSSTNDDMHDDVLLDELLGPATDPQGLSSSVPVGSPQPNFPTTPSAVPAPSQTSKKSGFQTPKATASRSKDSRLPTVRGASIFDRLYKTTTASSRAKVVVSPGKSDSTTPYSTPRTPRTPSNRNHTPRSSNNSVMSASTVNVDEVFQRLHITGTISNASKHSVQKASPRYGNRSKRTPKKQLTKSWTPMKTPVKTPSRGDGTSPTFMYSPRMKPLTTLYFDSKYHPGLGVEKLDPIRLGSSFFQLFCDYENGGITPKQLAREIIIAFFKKDFPAGRHWELHEPTVEEKDKDPFTFNVKMSATYDSADVFRVASAQGVVRCLPAKKEVRVLNYIYNVTSDL